MTALGFIETYGRVGAVEAADAALKAANVKLIAIRRVSGGFVTVIIKGEVAAVQSAIETAKIKAMRICRRVNTNIIPRPADSTLKSIAKIRRKE